MSVYIFNICDLRRNEPIDFSGITTMPMELYKATYLYLREYCVIAERISEGGKNMRCKVGDKDGGRAKRVPVQMEPLWGFWTVCMCVCVCVCG